MRLIGLSSCTTCVDIFLSFKHLLTSFCWLFLFFPAPGGPPPPGPPAASKPPAAGGGRAALLSSIQGGAVLRKVGKPVERNELAGRVVGAGGAASSDQPPPPPKPKGPMSMQEEIAARMAKRG